MNPMRIGGANLVDPVMHYNTWSGTGGTVHPSLDPVNITHPNDLTHDNWQVPSQAQRSASITQTAQSVIENLRRAFG